MFSLHLKDLNLSLLLVPSKAEKKKVTESGSYCAISDNESSSVTLNKLAMNARRSRNGKILIPNGDVIKEITTAYEPFHQETCCMACAALSAAYLLFDVNNALKRRDEVDILQS